MAAKSLKEALDWDGGIAEYRNQFYEQTYRPPTAPESESVEISNPWRLIKRTTIAPAGLNNRRNFDPDRLADLAADMREHGILQPLVVRRRANAGPGEPAWDLIAGERRWRAADIAGIEAVPCVVRDCTDAEAQVLTIVENVQRADLDPIEEAHGYRRLADLGHTQAEIAEMTNRSQPVVAKVLSLLALPEDVQGRIIAGELSATAGQSIARQWEAHPAIASGMARVAVEQRLSSREIDKSEKYLYQLNGQELRSVSRYGSEFDISVCEACPFAAFVRNKNENYPNYCANPEHYDQLTREARAAAAERQRAEIAARIQATADAPLAPEEIEARVAELPRAEDLEGDWVALNDPPAGCGEGCACRKLALLHGRIAAVCTDVAHYRELQDAEQKARKERRRIEADSLYQRASFAIETAEGLSGRTAALLAAGLLYRTDRAPVVETFKRHGLKIDGSALSGYGENAVRAVRDSLAGQDPIAVLRATALALLAEEGRRAIEYGQRMDLASWLVGLKGDEAADPGEDAGDEEEDDDPDRLECEQCGGDLDEAAQEVDGMALCASCAGAMISRLEEIEEDEAS